MIGFISPNKGFPRSESGVVLNSSDLSDSSRRLMPVEIDEYDDFDLDFDVDSDDELFPETGTFTRSCPKCFQPSVPEWKISPLEMYPDRWNYNQEGGAPWSHEKSYEMFNLNNFLENSKEKPSVQFQSPPRSPQAGMRGGIAGSAEKSLVQYRGGSDAFGRSFMFCPKAHLDLAPGLQELAKLKITSQKEDEKKRPLIQVNEVDEAVSILSESRALIPNWDANLESRTSSGAKGGDDPYMSILVPASSVTGMGFQELGYENKDAWLEIECQVTSLKLFGGVAFNFDSEADII